MKVVRDVYDVPDGQPYVLIKLGGQRKRDGTQESHSDNRIPSDPYWIPIGIRSDSAEIL